MIPFDPSFFEKEIRNDFEVDTTMKTCWAAEMELLFEIDCICEKYDIPYFVCFGTLLGTIRHKGFIPWDDDIDIALKREDFERLMAVLKDELPKEYVISNPLTGENATEYWASVRNGNTISISPERLERYHGCPFVVGIDIFQLDYLPREKKLEEEHVNKFHIVWTTVRLAKKKDRTEEEDNKLTILLDEIERVFGRGYDVTFDREDNDKVISDLVVLANKIASSINADESDDIVSFIGYLGDKCKRNPKEYFDNIEWLPFESIYVPVPKEWDKILTSFYKDYMVPQKFLQEHDYPFYKTQLEYLRQLYREMMGE